MDTLVSVVIPVYNGIDYLENTVKSVLAQDYSKVEILLINDGSVDGSDKLIDNLARQHLCIKAFHKPNGGVAAARNFGIDKAEGELIAFCDQDDLWLPSKLSKQVPLFANPLVGLVYCGAIAEYTYLNQQKKPSFDKQFKGDVFDKLIQVNMFTCCTAVARKSVLLAAEAFDSDRDLMGVDDWLAWLKLSLICEFDFVAEHLAIHVFHGDNYSSNEEKMHKAELVCLSKIAPLAAKHNKLVDWQEVQQNLHVRYANNYIHNGMFNLAGNTLVQASALKNNQRLKVKGWVLKLVPDIVWRTLQRIKRTI